jgi:heterotetrameric sarcosine oxidase gamma subunit
MTTILTPTAQGPLLAVHEAAGATIETRDGWRIAVRYPRQRAPGGNSLIDLSHRPTWEVHGPDTGARLQAAFGRDVPVRAIHSQAGVDVYRLTAQRAIVFGRAEVADALDVTGGWASLALVGPRAADILGKITALDLRPAALPPGACCQGPMFHVTALIGRLTGPAGDRFELHVGNDSAQFIWEVLLDAGLEFSLTPAGLDDQTL